MTRCADFFSSFPVVDVYSGVYIKRNIMRALGRVEKGVKCSQLCFDDSDVYKALSELLDAKKTLQLVLDHNQHVNPSCSQQHARVCGLANWGAQIRTYQPEARGFAMQHSKVLIIDDSVIFVGSANLTFHSLHKNHECVLFARDRRSVSRCVMQFEDLWRACQVVVTREAMGAIVKTGRHPASRGRRSRSASRERTPAPSAPG